MRYKHNYDKILTRLVAILSKLNDGEVLSVSNLAEEFNVSKRTIQRDFNERLSSFPIEKEGIYWKMQDGFRLEKTSSIEDTIILDILEGFVEATSSKFASKAKKLLSKLKNSESNPIYAKLDIEDISSNIIDIQLLKSAIKKQTIIQAFYNINGYKQKVELKPLKIVNYDGFWYLIAIDNRVNKLKKYYLKNLINISLEQKNFTINKKLDQLLENSISIWFDDKREPFEVLLHIEKEVAKYFTRKPISKTQVINSCFRDGSIEIALKITHSMEIIPLVKYWIPHIRVITPLFIKEEIEKDVREYFEESLESKECCEYYNFRSN